LKTAIVSGPDNIPPEAMKANPYLTANILCDSSVAFALFEVTFLWQFN
jgi:hypothetical protein